MKTIELGPVVIVSDPCYEVGTWCQAQVDNVLPGNYKTDSETLGNDQTHGWGTRVSALAAVHEDYVNKHDLSWELTNYDIGVDSGQAGIFDLNSYRKDHLESPILDNVKPMFDPDDDEGDEWYTKMCTLTDKDENEERYGVYESGVVSSSGYGDGSYNLWVARNKQKEIVGFVIDFGINPSGVSFPQFNFEIVGFEEDEYDEEDEGVSEFDIEEEF